VSKKISLIVLSLIVFSFTIFLTSPLKSYAETSITWGKIQYKVGYIGKVIVLKDTNLISFDNNQKEIKGKTIKKGQEIGIYTFKNNLYYGVGGGLYIKKTSSIKYETPSPTRKDVLKKLFIIIKLNKVREM
jgi:hypothetical protein